MKRYKVTFCIRNGRDKPLYNSVEIEASDEVAAQNGAFKTSIMKKYTGKGYRFQVIDTEPLDV